MSALWRKNERGCGVMSTNWKAQQSAGDYRLQFQTDDKEKYKLVEKAAQMAVDGKHTADIVEVVRCMNCNFRGTEDCPRGYYLELAGDYVDPTEDDDFCSYGERKK